VALRHGTNQASKASAAQMPLAILGGLLGSNSTGAALAQLGAGFTVNSILLKYSRDAESQADLMGTQILFDSGSTRGPWASSSRRSRGPMKSGRALCLVLTNDRRKK
jgi:predicted Zn-dependent protease